MADPLVNAIDSVVNRYGFKTVLASERWLKEYLWQNAEENLRDCDYGIVVLEGEYVSANVAFEAGYLVAIRKQFLILRERAFRGSMVSLEPRLYEIFDRSNGNLTPSVTRAVSRWLEKRGHRVLSPIVTISGNTNEAKRLRTVEIIDALQKVPARALVRQAGSLSSLAISNDEMMLKSEDPGLQKLLLEEKHEFERLLDRDVRVRCLISPFIQIASVQIGALSPDYAEKDALPRIVELRRLINQHLDNHRSNLQVAVTSRLPHDNILIAEQEVYLGRRRLQETGFPETIIRRDPGDVKLETDSFDAAFRDAVAASLRKNLDAVGEHDYGSDELKRKVIGCLNSCETQLRQAIQAGDISLTAGERSNPLSAGS